MRFVNLPDKNTSIEIIGEAKEHCFQIHTSENWIICEIGKTTEQQTANDIACAIREARDRGYRQAFEDIRAFLNYGA